MDRFLALLQGIPSLLVVFTFLFFLCLMEGVFLYISDPDRQHRKRLQKRLQYLDKLERRLAQGSLLKADSFGTRPWLRQLLKRIRHLEQLQTLLLQADVSWPLGLVLLGWLICGALGLSLGFFRWGPPGGLAGLVLGLYLPYKALKLKKKFRLKKFEKQWNSSRPSRSTTTAWI